MRDLFPGWVPPDDATLSRYWNEATFAVDASVLLDLYRFSGEARIGLLNALRSLEDRLWIPHQVALEFHHNRFSVLLAQREAENTLLTGLDGIKGELLKQLGERLRGAGRRDIAPLEKAIENGFDRLRENLKEAEKEHTEGLGQSIGDDPIYNEVVDLCAGRVGDPFDRDQAEAVLADAEERFRTETPPGYLDAEKKEKQRYGDVFVWHQLCARGRETGKPVVLISDDQKADWIWEIRGKTLGPRPELVAEMYEQAGVGFHIYTPTRFLQVWEQREEGREIEPEVLAELEEPASDLSTGRSIMEMIRQTIEAAGTQKALAGPWVRVGSFYARANPSHSIGPSGVNLGLDLRVLPERVGPPSALVNVRSPDGSEIKAQSYPIQSTVDHFGQLFVYRISYPAQFPAEVDLSLGAYEVTWEVAEDPSEPLGSYRKVVSDQFTIGED